MSHKIQHLAGSRIGIMTLVKELAPKTFPNGVTIRWYQFRCDCGKLTERCWDSKGKSCGCIRNAQAMLNGKTTTLSPGTAAFNTLFSNYRWAAIHRGLAFDVTKEEFQILTSSNCSYCGTKPASVFKKSSGSYIYNGVDRIDNTMGYINGNMSPCCEQCNKSKRKLSKKEFLLWIKSVYDYSIAQQMPIHNNH